MSISRNKDDTLKTNIGFVKEPRGAFFILKLKANLLE